ncbi:serine/threonine protein kinase [Pyrococcus kukulkanii]|uniref:serine/threonine protein kinase n=1 Tax=Pyrococcus kukulkanii TaxID=1609559 RepID=UPI0035676402
MYMLQEIIKDEIRKLKPILSNYGIKLERFLAKGTTSYVFLGTFNEEKVVIKYQRPDTPRKTLGREAHILEILRGRNITGDLIFYTQIKGRELLVRKYVDGELLINTLPKKEDILKIAEKAYVLDILGIDHGQIQGGKHIIIGNDVWIIDFEKASTRRKPRNLTSAMAMLFLSNNVISRRISIKYGITGDFKEMLRSALREYKVSKDIKKVMEVLSIL